MPYYNLLCLKYIYFLILSIFGGGEKANLFYVIMEGGENIKYIKNVK